MIIVVLFGIFSLTVAVSFICAHLDEVAYDTMLRLESLEIANRELSQIVKELEKELSG